jgi:PAS domain S-box-containing protein
MHALLMVAAHLLLPSACTPAHAAGELRAGYCELPPLIHSAPSGAPEGILRRVMDLIADREGWRIGYRPVSLAAGVKELGSGALDLLIAFSGKALEDGPGAPPLSAESLAVTWGQVFAFKEERVESVLDLDSRTVGIVQGDPHGGELRRLTRRFNLQCRYVEFEDYHKLLTAIDQRWIDAGLLDHLFTLSREMPAALRRTPVILSPVELRLAYGRQAPPQVIAAIDYHLNELKADKRSPYHRWMAELDRTPRERTLILRLAYGLALALAVLVLVSGGAFLLRRQVREQTEQLRSELDQRHRSESERMRLASAVEQTSDAVLITDPDQVVRYANPAFEALTGFAPQQAMACLARGTASGLEPPEEQSAAQGVPVPYTQHRWSGRIALPHKSGRTLHTLTTVSPVHDHDGRLVHHVTIMRDVTAAVQLEQQLVQTQKIEALGRLAGGIAHDFNNLLTAILGNIELAMMVPGMARKPAERLSAALAAADRARQLTRQILTFSRGSDNAAKQPLSIGEIVLEVVDLIQSAIPAGIQLSTDLDPAAGKVLADPGQIHQVVMNLCNNAIQAILPGEGRLALRLCNFRLDETRLGARSAGPLPFGDYICLCVEDTGRGMDGATRERIFEPFFTTKGKGEGTGMGLAVVHGIVRAHGGAIQVESALGQGTTFQVLLPRCAVSPRVAGVDPARVRDRVARVLLVDDEPAVLAVASQMLQKSGHVVDSVPDGQAALDRLAAAPGRFDLIVTDYKMPRMNGVDLALRVMRQFAGFPMVLMSGYSDQVQPETFRKFGFVDFLSKPFTCDELQRCVQYALDDLGPKDGPNAALLDRPAQLAV